MPESIHVRFPEAGQREVFIQSRLLVSELHGIPKGCAGLLTVGLDATNHRLKNSR